MPLHLKRRDGSLTPFRHSEYIPFYYFIPKSILSRCGAELNSIPRNPQKLLHDSAACDFVESDLFMLLIYDATAYMALVWEKDMAKAEKTKSRFEKCIKYHPYQSDIQSERELIEIAEKINCAQQ